MTTRAIVPSPEQQAIFDWVADGTGHGLVRAVAGSGKTTTLVEAAAFLQSDRALFCAFNKHIQQFLQQQLKQRMTCKTVHGLGLAALEQAQLSKALRVEDNKSWDLVREVVSVGSKGRRGRSPGDFGRILKATVEAIHYARVTLTPIKEAASLAALQRIYRLDIAPAEFSWWHGLVREALRESIRLARDEGIIDFDDMLWLPYFWELPLPRYDWVFVDECQDLSLAQLDLVAKCLAPEGRLLGVGDAQQAIYGFAGADAQSLDRLCTRFTPTLFPLSLTYRCPQILVEHAQLFSPLIQPRAEAPAGTSRKVSAIEALELITDGDLVLSRKTAPLVEACLGLLSQKKHARVKGRGIGQELLEHLRKLRVVGPFSADAVEEALEDYGQAALDRISQTSGAPARIQELLDQLDALGICCRAFDDAPDMPSLLRAIGGLFGDERTSITLSTVHRAKGLEANRVFLLQPEALPLRWAEQQPWEMEQERNLKYVALTRARETLFWVTASPLTVDALARLGAIGEPEPESPPTTVARSRSAPSARKSEDRAPDPPLLQTAEGWHIGDWVQHPTFGRGVIVDMIRQDKILIVGISFEGDRIRKVVPAIAKLEHA